MKYRNPDLVSALAAEYVVGTLRGRARDRFERLVQQRADIREAVNHWQNHFGALDVTTKPESPSDRCWVAIEQRLFGEVAQLSNRGVHGFWRWLGLSASTLSLVLGLYIALPYLSPDVSPIGGDYISVFQDEETNAIWTVRIDRAENTLQAKAQNVPAIAANQDYELWLLPADNQPPVSLGLLPKEGNFRSRLPDLAYEKAAGIAVSLEPKGGSTTGAPTGPVLYVTTLLDLG